MVYVLTEEKQGLSRCVEDSLRQARLEAEKGNVFIMQEHLEDALKYSFGANISAEINEIKGAAVKNAEYKTPAELVNWLKLEAEKSKTVFLDNILSYAASFAGVFGWNITREVEEIRTAKGVVSTVSVANFANRKKKCNRIIRFAGYCDI